MTTDYKVTELRFLPFALEASCQSPQYAEAILPLICLAISCRACLITATACCGIDYEEAQFLS